MAHYLAIIEMAEEEEVQQRMAQNSSRFQDLSKLKKNVQQDMEAPPHPLFNPEAFAEQNKPKDPFAVPSEFIHAPVGRQKLQPVPF